MAELLLKVGSTQSYDDGDILCAFNRRSIRCVHAQHLCHIRTARRNASGLIFLDEVARDWFELTHQYRFERISANQVRRTEIATGERADFSSQPNERGEQMDVRLFVRRRKRKADHGLFGEDGREVWYGGRVDMSSAKLDKVWAKIADKKQRGEDEPEFKLWPMGRLDLKHHFAVPVVEFDDATAAELLSPVLDVDRGQVERKVLAKRKRKAESVRNVALEMGITEETVRDPNVTVDRRGNVAPLDLTIKVKLKDKTQEVRDAALDLDAKR